MLEGLRHVAAVEPRELEDAGSPPSPNAEPAQHQAAHDAARGTDDDHDADPHPNGDARTAAWPGRQEHERVVVAGLGSSREPGRDGQRPDGAGSEHEAAGAHRQPGRRGSLPRATTFGRPRRSSANPARATSTTSGRQPAFVTRTAAWPDP